MRLNVYYDNPNSASDMYLKYLTKDCEANNIEINLIDNIDDWETCLCKYNNEPRIYLEPTIEDFGRSLDKTSVFNVDYPSATAEGIYQYVTKMYPSRAYSVGVIGRGLVGKQLLDKLIQYGYTVIEMNSQTPNIDLLSAYCDILIGLSSVDNILKSTTCDALREIHNITLIDASNNFDTKDKLRCGKWTRSVIINRIKKIYGKEV